MSEKKPTLRSDEHIIHLRPPRPHETPPMIINDISHLFHGKMRSMETEGIMSQHGARMIAYELSRREGLRQIDLVRLTHMKAPTVSVIVKKMAAEGLLTHEVQFSDLRSIRLYLTEKGRALHETTRRSLRSTDEIMMAGFTEEEAQQLKAMLCRVRDNLLSDLESNGLLRPASTLDEKEDTPKEDGKQ
ncbi:MAG: MarR family transcriptional regulator [Clostridia bacterium]|nr:MarR family transcriptional regulator [Clostridia bacterium]